MGSKSSVRASSIPSVSNAVDSGELEHLTTPQLIVFLKSSFLKLDFEEVSRILSSREESMREELVKRQAAKMDLESRCWALESETAFLKSRSIELEEKLKRGDGGLGLRTKIAELERMLREEKERSAMLEAKSRELDCAKRDHEIVEEDCSKRRAPNESDIWKRKYGELEARCLQLVEEKLILIEKLKTMDKEKGEKQPYEYSRTRVVEDCKPLFGGIIDICDSDDERVERVAEAPGLVRHRNGGTPYIKREPVREESPETMHFEQKIVNAMCDDNRSRYENPLLAPAPRRKHFSGVITIGLESENYDDEDDRIPIGKLKMKKLSEVIEVSKEPKSSIHRSYGCNDNLVPLRQRKGVKDGIKGESSAISSAHTLSPADTNNIFSNNVSAHQMLGYVYTKYVGEDVARGRKEVDDVESETQNVPLSESIVHGYADTNGASRKETASVSALDKVSSKIRGKKGTNQWEYKADMLSSLSKDPELCLKAVCAIYRSQSALQKSAQGMLPANNRGFNAFDAYMGSRMAEFLTDGAPRGPLKKSVEELQKHNPQGLDYCYKLATHYSQELFLIYQNKEDPYFSPS